MWKQSRHILNVFIEFAGGCSPFLAPNLLPEHKTNDMVKLNTHAKANFPNISLPPFIPVFGSAKDSVFQLVGIVIVIAVVVIVVRMPVLCLVRVDAVYIFRTFSPS